MSDLSNIPTDDIIAEMERRLESGVVGFHGLYSTNQQNWREAWTDVMGWLNDNCNADFERWQPHRAMMIAALERHGGDNVQERRKVYAVNTTYHGKEAMQDHAVHP